jgi:L-ascorbate metabolism protein UlaG (beta-lactamase superfamily)
MKIHHLRSATFVIESGNNFILVDPMLGKKGSIPPFSVIRKKAQRNPTVELPDNADAILAKVTHCLVTHSRTGTLNIKALQHQDHLDIPGETFLRERKIPVVTMAKDKAYLESFGMNVELGLESWQNQPFLGGTITAVPCQHGHGWIHKLMANGIGFFLQLEGKPSIYISGDTVLTSEVKRALQELKPDITVIAAGEATMDIGRPLLMQQDEIVEFIRYSPGKVIANHMEALNHCHIDRPALRELLSRNALSDKVMIPADGEVLRV